MNKICTRCGLEKDQMEFVKRSTLKSGYAAHCKACQVKITMAHQKLHPEKKKEAYKKWRETHKEYVREEHRKWAKTEKGKETHQRWIKNNPDKYLAGINRAAKNRLSTLKGRLNCRMASAIRTTLKKGAKREQHWEDIVGFTIEQLKSHLEKRFTHGMTWENYGTYWHIDHKTPVSVFNFNRPEDIDFRICWSIANLQPLEAKENIRKGARIDGPFQPSLAIGG